MSYCSLANAAEVTGVSVRTLQRWAREGMPAYRDMRGRVFVRIDYVQLWAAYKAFCDPVQCARHERLQFTDCELYERLMSRKAQVAGEIATILGAV